MSFTKRIRQIAAPSGEDFDPRHIIGTEDIAIGATNIIESVAVTGDEHKDNKITLFKLPKRAVVNSFIFLVKDKVDGQTVKIGDEDDDDGFLPALTSVSTDNTYLGIDIEELGEYLMDEITTGEDEVPVLQPAYFVDGTEVIAEFSADPSAGSFVAWISYTILADPIEEIDFSKPEKAPYFRIREDADYIVN